MDATDFFATARERQVIYLRRQTGQPWPWTDDPTMRQYSITNVFRENDKTTRWFRETVRGPLRDKPEVLLATVLFRWFNRISTGEAIFKHINLIDQENIRKPGKREFYTAWEHYLKHGNTVGLRQAIVAHCGKGPYVTGSYIILGQQGMPKLDGVLKCLEMFYGGMFEEQFPHVEDDGLGGLWNWRKVAQFLLETRGVTTLEQVWRWLRQVPYLGDFMAYEIVTDLRHTALLDRAPDVMTWGNPGPGAARGLARLHGRSIEGRKIQKPSKAQMIVEMRELLALSRSPEYWPQIVVRPGRPYHLKNFNTVFTNRDMQLEDQWPAWELHEVEMWLCEYDKIMRARTGQGRPRGVYRPT